MKEILSLMKDLLNLLKFVKQSTDYTENSENLRVFL